MTLDEASKHIGDSVVYHPRFAPAEDGVITSVSSTMAFVDYGTGTPQATRPGDLELAATAAGGPGGPRGASMNAGPDWPPLLRHLPRMGVTRSELAEGWRGE